MDKGLKNYRDMMKRMEKDDPAIINPTRPSGMMGGTPDMLRPDNEVAKQLEELKMQNKPEETAMGRMGMAGMNAVEDAISGMSMADREAIEALTTMGISLEDAIEAIMGNMQENMLEGAVGATMGGGALQALPMQRPAMRDDMGADRTENPMNTITSMNAPST